MQSGETPRTQDKISDVAIPNPTDMQLQLEQLVQQGVLSPEEAKAAMADPSALEGITTDPKLHSAQMSALDDLQNIGQSGGLTLTDKANLSQIATDEATKARGQRESILNSAAARGMGGSGLELMAQLQNEQDSASNKSQRDLAVAGSAQQRALEALVQEGTLAGSVQNQDFNQAATKANATDAISKFNAQNQQTTNLANTAARNDAAAKNLAVKQGTSDLNTQIRNQEQQSNKNLIQQNFQNNLARAGGAQSVATQNSQAAGQNSQNNANANNQMIGTGLTAAAMFSDERMKEDIQEFSPSDFLDSVTGYKFKYKEPKKHGEGEHVGVMAQDLEKTDAGSKLVTDTPEGKVIDYGKAGPQILASLADINKRLKNLESDDDV